jgi:exodeoxyribonuclease VII small subunit
LHQSKELPVAVRKKTINFEQSIDELESLVEALESGTLSLEDSLKAFEKGVRITRECQDALKDAEQKISLLSQNSQGVISANAFDQPEES